MIQQTIFVLKEISSISEEKVKILLKIDLSKILLRVGRKETGQLFLIFYLTHSCERENIYFFHSQGTHQ